MNNFFTRYIVLLIFILGALHSTKAQQTHVITLKVNTAQVTKDNIATTCSFEYQSPNGSLIQSTGGSLEEFTIKVKVGDIVIWKGIPTSAAADRVDINAINHEGGKNVFDKNKLSGNGQQPEVVIGTVVTGAPGDVDKYKISFKVFNGGTKRNGTFHIDPKIQII